MQILRTQAFCFPQTLFAVTPTFRPCMRVFDATRALRHRAIPTHPSSASRPQRAPKAQSWIWRSMTILKRRWTCQYIRMRCIFKINVIGFLLFITFPLLHSNIMLISYIPVILYPLRYPCHHYNLVYQIMVWFVAEDALCKHVQTRLAGRPLERARRIQPTHTTHFCTNDFLLAHFSGSSKKAVHRSFQHRSSYRSTLANKIGKCYVISTTPKIGEWIVQSCV